MYAIDAGGERLWSRPVRGVVLKTLLVARQRVLVSGGARGGNTHKVRAYRANGTLAWSRDRAEVETEVMDGAGQVYVRPWTDSGTPGSRTRSVALRTGELALRIGRSFAPMAALPGDRVVIGTTHDQTFGDRMVALDTWGGNARWDYRMSPFDSIRNLAVDARRFYLLDNEADALVARSTRSGDVTWRTPVASDGTDRAVIAAGGLVFLLFQDDGDLDFDVYAYDARDGDVVARREVGAGTSAGHPVIAHGTLYVATRSGVRAYRPSA